MPYPVQFIVVTDYMIMKPRLPFMPFVPGRTNHHGRNGLFVEHTRPPENNPSRTIA